MKLVCLIIPPSPFLTDERVFVSLGILKVAAVLEKMGYPVHLLDLSGVENYLDVVSSYVLIHDVDFFGITSTTPQFPRVEKIARTIKALRPSGKICLGGPHATMVNAAYRRDQNGRAGIAFRQMLDVADVIVAGDGEEAILFALQENCPRIVDADDPDTSLFLNKEKLSDLPIPARHLVDLDSYHYSIEDKRATSLIAQLGCPYGCFFCGGRLSPTFRRARIRSSESVLLEIEDIYQKYGYTGYMFYDDELNVNPLFTQHMRDFIQLQEKLGERFYCRGFLKANLFTEEQAQVLKDAGFAQILIGFESGSERILTNIKKKATRAQNTRCMEIANKYGLKVKALMSLGHAGETEETIAATRDWLLEVKPYDFDLTIISVFPGTPYYDYAKPHVSIPHAWTCTVDNGDTLHSYDVDFTADAAYYKGSIEDGYQSFVFTDALSSDMLVHLRDEVEREVRHKLSIPFYLPTAAMKFEASMGQFPGSILRTS